MASKEMIVPKIEGRLWLEMRNSGGTVCARRFARNTVMRSGASLVASLISGKVTTPINGVAVGIDPTPSAPPYEITSLITSTGDGEVALVHGASPVMSSDMTIEVVEKEFKVRVCVSSTIATGRAVHPDSGIDRVMIAEAALGTLAADGETLCVIYNRVVFDPVPKTREHELTLFWEIDFPYGM